MSAYDIFSEAKSNWEQLLQAEKRGLVASFGYAETCWNCSRFCESTEPLMCSGCKAVFYCSQKCLRQNMEEGSPWEVGSPHTLQCASFKKHLERIPVTQGILKSFPWGRIEVKGTFYEALARLRFGVLGGAGFGYWSQRGNGHFEDEEEDSSMKLSVSKAPGFKQRQQSSKAAQKKIGFIDGTDLLKQRHPTDDEGWKLPADLVVRRELNAPGCIVPEEMADHRVAINNWNRWYQWRGVPKASIACLLMHYPLSVYWMLVNTLKVVKPYNPRQRMDRKTLRIHYIGAEVELNFLPIFSELALLLPHHDIHLTLFGPCVYYLGQEALKPKHVESLVHRSCNIHPNAPIYSYDAPEAFGAGSLRIILHTASKQWDEEHLYGHPPDAVVQPNAGLFLYDASQPAVELTFRLRIPFAVTDYQESLLEKNRDSIDMLVAHLKDPNAVQDRPIDLNPFHRPGQKHCPQSNIAPFLINGFAMPVYHHTAAA